jgi:hypothetical protein
MAHRIQIEASAKRYKQTRISVINPFPRFDWGSPFEGWARGFVKRNLWRVDKLLGDEEDGLQECALVFVRCRNKYEGRIDNPAWMMALFKSAVAHHWHDLARTNDPAKEMQTPDPDFGTDRNHGHFMVALSEAKSEIQDLMNALLSAPSELLSIIFRDDDPVLLNRRVKRLFGISGTGMRDLMAELRDLLSTNPGEV